MQRRCTSFICSGNRQATTRAIAASCLPTTAAILKTSSDPSISIYPSSRTMQVLSECGWINHVDILLTSFNERLAPLFPSLENPYHPYVDLWLSASYKIRRSVSDSWLSLCSKLVVIQRAFFLSYQPPQLLVVLLKHFFDRRSCCKVYQFLFFLTDNSCVFKASFDSFEVFSVIKLTLDICLCFCSAVPEQSFCRHPFSLFLS